MNTDTISDFLASHEWAQETKNKYGHVVRRFVAEVEDDRPDVFGPAALLEWISSHDTWGPYTRYYANFAVAHWLRYRYGDDHPALALRIKRPKKSPKKRSLNFEQVDQLLAYFDTSTPKGRRDLAMACLFIDTGLRVSEVARLSMDYLFLEERELSVIVKGGRWEIARYSLYTAACIARWLADRENIAKCNRVFVGIRTGRKMTREGIQTNVAKWGRDSGVGKLSPHDFRRTFATLGTILGGPTWVMMVGGRWRHHETFYSYLRSISLEQIDPYSPVMAVMKNNRR